MAEGECLVDHGAEGKDVGRSSVRASFERFRSHPSDILTIDNLTIDNLTTDNLTIDILTIDNYLFDKCLTTTNRIGTFFILRTRSSFPMAERPKSEILASPFE